MARAILLTAMMSSCCVAQITEISAKKDGKLGWGTTFHIGDGQWMTAAHVVSGTQDIRLGSRRQHDAELIWEDSERDVALIRSPWKAAKSMRISTVPPQPGTRLHVLGYDHRKPWRISRQVTVTESTHRTAWTTSATPTYQPHGLSGGPLFSGWTVYGVMSGDTPRHDAYAFGLLPDVARSVNGTQWICRPGVRCVPVQPYPQPLPYPQPTTPPPPQQHTHEDLNAAIGTNAAAITTLRQRVDALAKPNATGDLHDISKRLSIVAIKVNQMESRGQDELDVLKDRLDALEAMPGGEDYGDAIIALNRRIDALPIVNDYGDDIAELHRRIDALPTGGSVPIVDPISGDKRHMVLVANRSADYWSRLESEFNRAAQVYALRFLDEPEEPVHGELPALVAYAQGDPVKQWRGLRPVSDALQQIGRGNVNQILGDR